uniref:Alpha-2-HS-glycoprotein 2 n=1 Tax=Neogobius melanostomus TaxID=47308 RepID=A0A8C6WFP0_9GOBI
MKSLPFFMVAVGLLMGTCAQINVLRPECDSPEAEEAALVAQDYLNSQHTHGYKYALNRIEDLKIITTPNGDNTFVMEIDLLETNCHVLDPTPIANCTAVEGDCDVVLKNVSGALMVTAFKCKTEEDICLGCPTLLPLNDTLALDFVQASMVTFNNMTENVTFSLLEVGRMSSQIVSGGPIFFAEYVVVEANCTEDVCEPLNDAMASRGICTAKGSNSQHTVDCKMFPNMITVVDSNSTAPVAPAVHVHTGNLSPIHGLGHHKLKALHDPLTLLSAESVESVEVVPVAPASASDPVPATDPSQAAAAADPAPASDLVTDSSNSKDSIMFLFKRDVAAVVADSPAVQAAPVPLVPVCPGRIRFFD